MFKNMRPNIIKSLFHNRLFCPCPSSPENSLFCLMIYSNKRLAASNTSQQNFLPAMSILSVSYSLFSRLNCFAKSLLLAPPNKICPSALLPSLIPLSVSSRALLFHKKSPQTANVIPESPLIKLLSLTKWEFLRRVLNKTLVSHRLFFPYETLAPYTGRIPLRKLNLSLPRLLIGYPINIPKMENYL
jgi:hypothetical protein